MKTLNNMASGKESKKQVRIIDPKLEKRRKQVEMTATFGLLLIAVGLVAPFAALDNVSYLSTFKWIFAPGALIFTVARMVNVNDPQDSLRLRRLRRLEFWAGMAFCIAAFFWFYNDYKYVTHIPGSIIMVGPLKVLHETILFSMVGAMIQVISSWMINRLMKKELSTGEASYSGNKEKTHNED